MLYLSYSFPFIRWQLHNFKDGEVFFLIILQARGVGKFSCRQRGLKGCESLWLEAQNIRGESPPKNAYRPAC
ncbi:MAG: hypothetical protein DWQ05_02025 [Calditrichaeota bacterium]|nr:MAG: hypothetical protein DWQ05_02025 [Calditrichota bacterium]